MLMYHRLTDYLEKEATATDPGRVINISSVAGVSAFAEGSPLAGKGNGLWSCEWSKHGQPYSYAYVEPTNSKIDNTSKGAGMFNISSPF